MERSILLTFFMVKLGLFALFTSLNASKVVAQTVTWNEKACKVFFAQNDGPCMRWTYDFVEATDKTTLKASYPNNCDDSYGPLTCYWSKAETACQAYVKVAEKAHQDPANKPFKQKHRMVNATTWMCSYGWKNDPTPPPNQLYPIQTEADYVHVTPQPHCEMEVNGPYRNCSDQFTLCGTTYTEGRRGYPFTPTQKNKIKQTNKAKYDGQLKSDLAGFTYPKPPNENCIQADPNNPQMCIEPDNLIDSPNQASSGEVHHVIPRKDRQGCSCGRNSMKNAAVISRQLNRVLLNFPRPTAEINMVNMAGQNPYPCASQIARPPNFSKNKMRKNVKKQRKR